ncbi:MAG: NAD(P)/FAD-dependent oxidoreductase [candidate division KSB1 bacterium]|nr:NAD(P)/FAD-dependent oxidoreductase [candidate division KSB1 bacterium]MDZ7275139.1 NAD(P)/FAD-dependent oxidoreductase [candidate division KSB1 bacterium]MDZ7287309.1 NAD(P)/FAD-dependent oxidoreductase [candidate division KSB1 bacterium]MDZ7299423.1 NAD(P)/FAD-dependent oxidoreductase [candidate division KSB1 bacterium]MDZ7308062.1 NAD(P)/FAD-dependent oxidoreductase [candidate division KSB1 bacterium]
MERVDICIIGAGPAGIATAAALLKLRPAMRDHILLLEKDKHPRHKLCGGGLTPWVDQLLRDLDLTAPAPDFCVERVRFYLNDEPLLFEIPGLMRTIRRNEFDAALAECLRRKGVRLLENTAVLALHEKADGIIISTTRGDYHAGLVVGADGARSLVRRQFFRASPSRVSRLLEVLVPAAGAAAGEFESQTVVIDFRPMRQGLQGYVWDFPCWVNGMPHLNVGLFDSRVYDGQNSGRAHLPDLLARHLEARGFTPTTPLMGHPERWFHPADQFSRPRVLLAGEAAGIEPWLGEGISAALAYGQVAAEAIVHAFEARDFSLADYRRRILRHPLGRLLRRNRLIARLFYAPRFHALLPLFARVLHRYVTLKHRWTAAKEKGR